MSTRSRTEGAARRIGPAAIALFIAAPLTVALVAITLLHTPSPAVSASAATPAGPTTQSSTPTASATPEGRQTVAFLGDSYASGVGASRSSRRWATLVSRAQGWTEKNLSEDSTSYSTAGQPGGTSYLARLEAVISTKAQIVVVSGGRNDVDVAAAELRADVRATFAGIRTGLPDARIIVVSPTWDNAPAPARMTALTAIVKAEAKRVGATYLDIGEPMLGHFSMVTFDGVHPNDTGHAAIAAAVEKALA